MCLSALFSFCGLCSQLESFTSQKNSSSRPRRLHIPRVGKCSSGLNRGPGRSLLAGGAFPIGLANACSALEQDRKSTVSDPWISRVITGETGPGGLCLLQILCDYPIAQCRGVQLWRWQASWIMSYGMRNVPNRLLGLSTRFPTDAAVLVCDSFERWKLAEGSRWLGVYRLTPLLVPFLLADP